MTNDDSRAASAGAADATTVAAYLAGDRSALATIWDRYGDTLYDTAAAMTGNREDAADMVQDVFVLAAEKLGQLRDPTRLKPWLFAILRNEVYRRSRRRSKSVVTDFSEAGGEVMLPPTPSETDAVEDAAEFDDLAELLRGAARGLDSRDQLVLELTMRQDLSGNDLADALGVTPQQSYGLVHRMRERTERSLGAYCVARRGRKECEELASILSDWDGEFSVLVRKRVARHVDACSTCERTRRRFAPLALIGAAPAFAAPPGLRDRVLDLLGASGAGTSTGDGSTELDSTQLDSSQFESTQFESAQSTHLSSSQRGGVARARFDSAGFPKGLSIVQRLGAATVAGVAASALIVVGGVTVIGIDDGPPELPPIVVEADGGDEGAIVLTSDTTTTEPPEAVASEQVSVT
ncbi:MAG: RNA polymerase sigma factor, partial [Ilumatobacteraceae bacterium]